MSPARLAVVVGSAVALTAVAASGIADAAPGSPRGSQRGRVVRVDRVRPPAAIPRMCRMMMEDRMLCIGKPAVGDTIHLFEMERGKLVGELRVDSVNDFMGNRLCPGRPAVVFEVTGTIVVGAPDLLDGTQRVVGLRNSVADAKSRLMKNVKPQPRPDPSAARSDREVEMAVDLDGDNAADFVLEHQECPETGRSSRTPATCFDTYLERNGKLELVQRDAIEICS